LALMYGMGQNRLAEQLDIDVDSAKELISQYHTQVPFVKALQEAVQRHIKDERSGGEIRSLLGRKCRFPLWEPNLFVSSRALPREEALTEYGPNIRRAFLYKGLNRLIQSSGADMTKAAMVKIKEELGEVALIQIHDELAFSVPDAERAREICKVMEHSVEMQVPTPADISLGKNWGELNKIR
jgi:DNA polymerase I-like protein with 3'-5' exonuclease and polymerase domains